MSSLISPQPLDSAIVVESRAEDEKGNRDDRALKATLPKQAAELRRAGCQALLKLLNSFMAGVIFKEMVTNSEKYCKICKLCSLVH